MGGGENEYIGKGPSPQGAKASNGPMASCRWLRFHQHSFRITSGNWHVAALWNRTGLGLVLGQPIAQNPIPNMGRVGTHKPTCMGSGAVFYAMGWPKPTPEPMEVGLRVPTHITRSTLILCMHNYVYNFRLYPFCRYKLYIYVYKSSLYYLQ